MTISNGAARFSAGAQMRLPNGAHDLGNLAVESLKMFFIKFICAMGRKRQRV